MEFTNSDLLIKLLGIFISFFGVIVPLYKFITEKNLSQRDLRFKTYHLLIKQLVEPEEGKDRIMLDRQIATCFELRNFPEYFEITKRILTDLKTQWAQAKWRRATPAQYLQVQPSAEMSVVPSAV